MKASALLGRLAAATVAVIGLGVIAFAFVAPSRPPPAWDGSREAAGDPAAVAAPADRQALPSAKVAAVDLPVLRRGVNLSRAMGYARRDKTRPQGYAWPPFPPLGEQLGSKEMAALGAMGIDFVRLVVDAGPFLAEDGTNRQELLGLLRRWVEYLQKGGLAVLVDMHPATYASAWTPNDILADPQGGKFGRYAGLLQEVAAGLAGLPADKVALELMNEPQGPCEREAGEDWTVSQKRLFRAARDAAPSLPLVVTGPCWASPDGLMRLDAADFDAATLYDVHFYEPYYFTHQSIAWASPPGRYLAGLTWPAAKGSYEKTMAATRAYLEKARADGTPHPDDALARAGDEAASYYRRQQPGPDTIAARFDAMAAWADRNGLDRGRVVVGEFSAIRWPGSVADDGSRLRWIEAVRTAAETRGFGWALWDYNTGFGLLASTDPRTVDPSTARALGLRMGP
ncbi:hypothetical protein CSC94_20640 [Zhengella mangrovi]|uniref:Glycoside hydrolase family 5 domain-containing protein n=1 Tax=Zhengella mangrovi TaxID=1982044 RepID=A0A2G1QI20_9HYPH|nr:cellulase family glycosylhydrolase [Zhengella mangrovi]PHP65129.1 hypothetical protein CSC94_20640 [Zhengella mangrovi]